ncbi:Hypothetical protein HDN1F_11380 [gamma proteobacterium HdN1]|nr:Hypothetical protein HDN1F_11380 [gamma proteobacterium HdN1]
MNYSNVEQRRQHTGATEPRSFAKKYPLTKNLYLKGTKTSKVNVKLADKEGKATVFVPERGIRPWKSTTLEKASIAKTSQAKPAGPDLQIKQALKRRKQHEPMLLGRTRSPMRGKPLPLLGKTP